MKLILFFLFFLGNLSAKTLPPEWVDLTGKETPGIIEGVGFCSYKEVGKKIARDTAYNDALQKLSLKLKTTVKGYIKTSLLDNWEKTYSKKHPEIKDKSTEILESVTESIFDTVLGRKHFDEYLYKNKKEYWVKAWMTEEEMNRAIKEALEEQNKKMTLQLQSAIDIVNSGDNYLLTGDLIASINQYNDALKILSEITGIIEVKQISNLFLKTKIETTIKQVLNNIKMQKLSSVEESIAGKGFDKPIELKIFYTFQDKEIPVKNLPIKFEFISGKGQLENIVRTDETGRVKCNVFKVDTENINNSIEAKFYIDELLKISEIFNYLKQYKVIFNFKTISQKQALGIFIDINNDVFKKELSGLLSKDGFKIVYVMSDADIIISGEIQSKYIGSKITLPDGTEMDFGPTCTATAKIDAIETKTNKVITSKTISGIKGFGKTEQEAKDSSLIKSAEAIAKYLSQNLIP